jgi:hypothetical protein
MDLVFVAGANLIGCFKSSGEGCAPPQSLHPGLATLSGVALSEFCAITGCGKEKLARN